MPKRQRSSDHIDRRPGRESQRGLYLVLDDWSLGYSIRKVELLQSVAASDASGQVAPTIDRTEQPLPPALIHLETPCYPHSLMYFAAAFDTKLMAMHSIPASLLSQSDTKRASAYDVRARGMVVVPPPKENPWYPIYISTRDSFFALSGSSFERLALRSRMKPSSNSQYHCSMARRWQKLQDAPFESKYVACYAVHPDQQTVFVSVLGFDCISTFSFCTTGSLKWEKRGDWALPFADQAHYDHELNAWVGLSMIPDPIGHICTCNVASTTSDAESSTGEFLARRLSKEYLFSTEPGEETVGYNLVYMGGKSCFCLVEVICISTIVDENAYDCSEDEGSSYTYTDDDDDEEEKGPLYASRYLLRLTTFSLKFDENGDLTTGNSRRFQYYSVPQDATYRVLETPFAFWM